MTITIPNWVPPLPPAPTLNKQDAYNEIIATWLAEGAPIPVVLGEAEVGGKVFAAHYDIPTSTWTIGVIWCVGEVDSIQNTYINAAAPVVGVTQNDYVGQTSQTADSLLSAAIGGYADTLVITTPQGNFGVCYSVFEYDDTDYPSPPAFVAKIRGMEVNAGVYSNNPARCLRWLIEDDIHGLNESVDATSFNTVATDNDATVIAEARRTLGLVISRALPTIEWVKILAGYASCWVYKEGGTWYAVSDRPRSSDETITNTRIVKDSLSVTIADRDVAPTVVEVVYTDTREAIHRDKIATAELAGVSAGTTPRRVSRVQMPGVVRYSQAKREAEERLAKLNKVVQVAWNAPPDDLERQVGDVVTLTHSVGFTSKAFRIIAPPINRRGVVELRGVEYDSGVYNDTEASPPSLGTNSANVGGGAGGTGSDGAPGIPGLPASSTLLAYDDLETAEPNGAGKYSLLTTLGDNNSGTNTNAGLEAAVGLILDDDDANSVDQDSFLDSIVVGDTFTYYLSNRRWYFYQITSLETNPTGRHKFGITFIVSDTNDGTGVVSDSPGLDVTFRFSRGAAGADGAPGIPGTNGLNFARTMALLLEKSRTNTTTAGEGSIVGVEADGTIDFDKSVNPTFLWNGSIITVPHLNATNTFATGVALREGFICVNTALPGNSFTVAATATDVAFVFKNSSGNWVYDNNGSEVAFTPTNDYVAIGWIYTDGTDSIGGGGIFGEAITLTLAMFPGATKGAIVGTDLKDSSGNVLTPGQVENDFIVGRALGGSIIPNSYLDWTRTDDNGDLLPNHWYVRTDNVATNPGDDVSYVDEANRDKLSVVGGSDATYLISTAFRVNQDVEYEVVIRARSVGVSQAADLYWIGTDTDMQDGKVALYLGATGGIEDEVQQSATNESNTSIACTTSFQVFSWDIGSPPDANNEWASIAFRSVSGESHEIDYIIVREKGSSLTVGKLSQVANATSAGPIDFAGTTWIEIETVALTLPADVSDTDVLIDFTADIELTDVVGAPPPEAAVFSCQIQVLDNADNPVDTMNFLVVGTIINSSTPIKEMIGTRQVVFSPRIPSGNLVAGVENTFKIQMRELSATATEVEAQDIRLRALALHRAG